MKPCKQPDLSKYVAVCLLFVVFFILPSCLLSSEEPNLTSFEEQVTQKVALILKGRDGVVIWFDRNSSEKIVFGNVHLLDQKFLPGSLMKLILTEVALEKKISFYYKCNGSDLILGKKRYCWNSKGHGNLDLPKALSQSCNLFFSQLGVQIGVESILSKLKEYHLFENDNGTITKKKINDHLTDLSIGDWPSIQFSPLEIFEFWNQYLLKIEQKKYTALEQGLLRTFTEGTASKQFLPLFKVLGKTGTGDSLEKAYKTNGWFLAAYPALKPRYLLLVFLKEAHGFREPVKLANEIFRLAKKERVIQ